jgi:hypothetical protein
MTKLISILFLALIACKPTLEVKEEIQFNCDSLIAAQVKWLHQQNLALKKLTSVSGGNTFESFPETNKIDWKKELAPFSALNGVNKPSYRNSYMVSVFQDDKSNLKVKYWNAEGKEPPLRTLKVYFLTELDKVKNIEAVFVQKSLGFTSHKELKLEFNFIGGKTVLERYQVSGYQKFLTGSSEHYNIVGSVVKK